jgi:hypothetical protein
VAVRVTVPAEAVIVTVVDAVTEVVETVKLALVAPAATVTLGGTVAAALLLDSVTPTPPAGAAAVSVTVPCAALPPVTLVGLIPTADNAAAGGALGFGKTETKASFVTDPDCALIVTDVKLATEPVVSVKLFTLFPAAITTLAGTCTLEGSLLESTTEVPPGGAGVASPTVPVMVVPLGTDSGLTVNADTFGFAGCSGSIRITAPCVPPSFPYDAWIITQ